MAHVDLADVTFESCWSPTAARSHGAYHARHAMGIGRRHLFRRRCRRAVCARGDAGIALGGRTATESYLDIEGPCGGEARRRRCVHPGYGLSETRRLRRRDRRRHDWVSPSPDAIKRIGDKLAAKRRAVQCRCWAVELTRSAARAPRRSAIHVRSGCGWRRRPRHAHRRSRRICRPCAGAARAASAFRGHGVPRGWLTNRAMSNQDLGVAGNHAPVRARGVRSSAVTRKLSSPPSPAVDEALRERMGGRATAARRLAITRPAPSSSSSAVEFFFLEIEPACSRASKPRWSPASTSC